MGTGENQELAAIVPRTYCTRKIGARQEESAWIEILVQNKLRMGWRPGRGRPEFFGFGEGLAGLRRMAAALQRES